MSEESVEYAVMCADGWTTGAISQDKPMVERYATYQNGVDTHKTCGPHRVVSRTVSAWVDTE